MHLEFSHFIEHWVEHTITLITSGLVTFLFTRPKKKEQKYYDELGL